MTQDAGGRAQRGAAVPDEGRPVHGREHPRMKIGEFVQAAFGGGGERHVVHQHRVRLVGGDRRVPSSQYFGAGDRLDVAQLVEEVRA